MKINKYIIAGATAVILGSGCGFFGGNTLKVSCYQPVISAEGSRITGFRVGVISNTSGAGREFLVREKGSRIKTLYTMRWLNSPEVMLKSAMMMRFAGAADDKAVAGQIIRFYFSPELDMLNAVIIFSLRSGESVVCEETVAVQDGDYGAAASKIFENAINKVAAKVKK